MPARSIVCAVLVPVLVGASAQRSLADQPRWRRYPLPFYERPLLYPRGLPAPGQAFVRIRPRRFGPYPVYSGAPGGPYPATVLPLPDGMILDIPSGGAGARSRPVLARVDRWPDVGLALRACWSPPAAPLGVSRPRQLTLRLGFGRRGNLLGTPRVTFADPARTSDVQRAFSASVMEALRRCVPLPFTAGLGSAIAGVPFALRFIDEPASSPAKDRS